jgi:hypothetical protein
MKNKMKFLVIIALIAVIGFSMAACPTGGGGGGGGTVKTGSGQYTGKDALGNSYKLYVGSDASRAAIKGDNFRLEITLDGKTYIVTGTVTDISTDGSLTLKPSKGGDTFKAVVKGNNLNSVTGPSGGSPELTSDDGKKFTPRTFNTIHLRANRWSYNDSSLGFMSGESCGADVLLKDFPTDVKEIKREPNRYTITVSGTSDKNLDHLEIEVFGLTEKDENVFLAKYDLDKQVRINQAFTLTFPLDNITDNASLNLMDYKEIIMKVMNLFDRSFDEHPDWNKNYGTMPANILQDQIFATISNFKISLKDTSK